MANTSRVCPSCHLFGNGCTGKALEDGNTCPHYERHMKWLVRQVGEVRQAESRTRALAAVGAISLLLSLGAWTVMNDRDAFHLTVAQAQASATKVMTADASGPTTSTR